MDFGMRMDQVQKQSLQQNLEINQRMIQSMELLQLPMLQFEERMEEEYRNNPLLEKDNEDPSEENVNEDPVLEDREDIPKSEKEEREYLEQVIESSDPEYADQDDRLIYRKDMDYIRRNREEDTEQYLDYMNSIPSRGQSLQDHLIEQLYWFDMPDKIRNYAEEIIYNLDRRGYLTLSTEDLFGKNLSKEDLLGIETALQRIQSMDPRGVGARNLEECLLLQISPTDPDREDLILLIRKYLRDLGMNRLPHISKQTGLSFEEIQFLFGKIKKLKDEPGAIFDYDQNNVIRPDIIVEKGYDGNWRIRINEGEMASLHLSSYYMDLLKNKSSSTEDKKYIREKANSARWVLEMIKQRRTTLYNVAHEIVEHQKDFLERGPEAIRPLILKQIAEKINVHPSTVSRACCNKYMQTPYGFFPLKSFFSGAIASINDQDEAVAQNAALRKLKEIIRREDRARPFSDDELVEEMKDEGIQLSRRTVTKYRKMMDIPNSRFRKEW